MTAEFRRFIAQDPTVGAGNFFHRFAEHCTDASTVLLESDDAVIVGVTDCGRRLTVSLMRDIVERLVSWFLQQGVGERMPVGVFIADTPAYYLYYIALNRIGAIPVLLNSNMPGSVAADYLRRVGCCAIVVDRARADRLEPHRSALGDGPRIFPTDTMNIGQPMDQATGQGALEATAQYRPYAHHDDDTVLIAHTSGTTGAPKPVQFNHRGFFFGVRQQMLQPLGRRVTSALPHSHGSAITMLMSTVVRAVPLFAQTRKDPQSLLRTLEDWKPNLVMAFPKPLVDLCRVDLRDWDLSSVSCWMSTGDASHEPHIRRLIACGSRQQGLTRRKGSLFIDNLGSSEFAFGILRNMHSPETNRYERCIGMPFEWVDVQIFGEDGQPVPVNAVGRLGVKSPSVTSGYWKDRAATDANLLHGYWLTGDLVYRGADGSYYHVDRTTDRTLVANRMVYSCQLEELLLKNLPEVFDCTVVGVNADTEPMLAIGVEPIDMEVDAVALEERIQTVLRTRGVDIPARVQQVAPGWNEGLTGKKLKRVIRDTLGSRHTVAVARPGV